MSQTLSKAPESGTAGRAPLPAAARGQCPRPPVSTGGTPMDRGIPAGPPAVGAATGRPRAGLNRKSGLPAPYPSADGSGHVLPPSPSEAHPDACLRRGASARAEQQLVERVFERCHGFILAATHASPIPAEFLAALTANESGGNPHAVRFEPAVYRHLKAVAVGQSPRWGGIRREDLARELEEVLHPKASRFHAHYLTPPFAAQHAAELGSLTDEALRELATSWGFTQIMGYHMIGRAGTVRDLIEPSFHFRLARQLLEGFAQEYHLDLGREYEELFRCWNTGQPHGAVTDPAYVASGLRRMAIYKQTAAEALALTTLE